MTTATKERRKSKAGTSLAVADLKRALSAVAPAVPTRSPNPVLTNVLLSGQTLSATDLEMRIDAPLAWYHGPATLLPHDRLTKIVKELDQASEVVLRQDGASCVIEGDRVTYRLPTEDANEFPAVGDATAMHIAKIPASQFVALMQTVTLATDTESSRYALGGVLIEWVATEEGGMLTFVGTDGRRMCVAEAELNQATDPASMIVPSAAAEALCALADGADAVELAKTATELVATVDGVSFRARLLEGKFPRWRDVEPTREVKPTLVVAGALLQACRQAAVCTSEQSKGVTFTFSPDGLLLTSRSAEAGEASVQCEDVDPGHECTVALDPRFVVEWLKVKTFDKFESIEVDAQDAQSTVVLRAQNCRCVVMPIATE